MNSPPRRRSSTGRAVAVEVGPRRVSMLEAPKRAGRRVVAGGRNQEDRRQPITKAPIQPE